MRSRAVRLIALVMVAVASTLVSLLLAEFVLRRYESGGAGGQFVTNLSAEELANFDAKTAGVVTREYYNGIAVVPVHDANTVWRWPGKIGKNVEFLIQGPWNNYGCHDDLDYDSSPDRRGILFLGDSHVESMQVAARDTFYARLRQTKMAEQFTIYGCGVSGWGPTSAAVYLSGDPVPAEERMPAVRRLPNLKPAYVLYSVFMGNDLREEARDASQRDETPNAFQGEIDAAPVCAPSLVTMPPSGRSKLLFQVRKFYRMYLVSGKSDFRCIDDMYWPYLKTDIPAVEESWVLLFQGLDQMRSYTERFGGRLIVGLIEPYPVSYGNFALDRVVRFNYPGGKGISLDVAIPRERLRDYAVKNGDSFVDFSMVLRECGGTDHYYPSDLHLAARGHRCIADYLTAHANELFP